MMKTRMFASVACLALLAAACGGPAEEGTPQSAEQAPPAESTTQPTSEPSAGAEAENDEPEEDTGEMEGADAGDNESAEVGGLAGTAWESGEFTITFYEDGKMHVKGGLAGEDGFEGAYGLEDQALEISVAGQNLTGVFDGETLTVDGNQATRVE